MAQWTAVTATRRAATARSVRRAAAHALPAGSNVTAPASIQTRCKMQATAARAALSVETTSPVTTAAAVVGGARLIAAPLVPTSRRIQSIAATVERRANRVRRASKVPASLHPARIYAPILNPFRRHPMVSDPSHSEPASAASKSRDTYLPRPVPGSSAGISTAQGHCGSTANKFPACPMKDTPFPPPFWVGTVFRWGQAEASRQGSFYPPFRSRVASFGAPRSLR